MKIIRDVEILEVADAAIYRTVKRRKIW